MSLLYRTIILVGILPINWSQPASDDTSERENKPASKEKQRVRSDLNGDPLPVGANARMGTVRLRQPYPHVLFSPDGKTLISVGADNTLRTWDASTGKYLRGERLEGTQDQEMSAISLAPDTKSLVVWKSGRKSMLVYTVPTGKKLGSVTLADGQLYRVALAPGGKTVAVAGNDASGHFIRLWDVDTGAERQLLEHKVHDEHLAFSPDGKFLGAAGRDALRVWDVSMGKLLQQVNAEAWCLVFSPDSKKIASGNMDATVQLWDVATGKELATLKATPRHDIQCLAFSLDSKVLAAGGQAGLRIWDLVGRKEVYQLPDRMVYELVFAPNSKVLAASGGSNIRLWDVTTGKQLLHRSGHNDQVDSIAVSSDGKVLVSTSYSDGTLCFWDAKTGKLLHQPPEPNIAGRNVGLSADGKLAASGYHDSALHLWETNTGKELRRFPIEQLGAQGERPFVDFLQLSPDGKRLVAITRVDDWNSQINIWDTGTGKLLNRREFGGPFSFFTPDASSVTVQTAEGLFIHDVNTGRQLGTIPGIANSFQLAFSPDGKLMAAPTGRTNLRGFSVIEVVSGKEVLGIDTGQVNCLAFARDGQLLATSDHHVVRLWEIPTGKEILHRPQHESLPGVPAQADVTSLAFFPDGRGLATGMRDGTILIWDLAPETAVAKKLRLKEIEGLWADLAGNDVSKAYHAIRIFAASPTESLPYLRDHLQPVEEIELKHVERLIADLDSERFGVRDEAAKKLKKLTWEFEPAIRRALERMLSQEVRRNLEAILAAPQEVPRAPTLRTLRAIQVLERIGTQEARELLRMLANGPPDARLTKEAKASLERVTKQPQAAP
jgi:WD40 repeat protein